MTLPYTEAAYRCRVCSRQADPQTRLCEAHQEIDLSPEIQTLPLVLDGRYAVEETLGEGAMGVVYRARDVFLDRPVAIEMLPPDTADDETLASQLVKEAQIMARLRHLNVVQVYTVARSEGSWFIAMELVSGISLEETLEEHRARQESLDIDAAVKVSLDIVAGVEAIHRAGALHGDLKPGNVVVEHDTGRPVVIDLGLSTVETDDTGCQGGTPSYLAPELAQGHKLTAASDVYALGCTLFELLTGQVPYQAHTLGELLNLHIEAPVPLPSSLRSGAEPFDDVVQRAMAKDPQERFGDCGELREALVEARAACRHRRATLVPSARPRSMPPMSAGTRVLVVDDEEDFARFAVRASQLAFFRKSVSVRRVRDGFSAVRMASDWQPDIIVLDHLLPDMTGVTALAHIRQSTPETPPRVMVVSADVKHAKHHYMALGVRAFIDKPVGLESLVDAIAEVAEVTPYVEDVDVA